MRIFSQRSDICSVHPAATLTTGGNWGYSSGVERNYFSEPFKTYQTGMSKTTSGGYNGEGGRQLYIGK